MMRMDRRRFLGSIAAAGALAAWPAQAAQTRVMGGEAFGSYWRLVSSEADGEIADAVARVVAKIDLAMSPWRPDSELSYLNRAQAWRWLTISPDTRAVLDAARIISVRTHGAFDPTVGPVVGRYGFGPITAGPAGRMSDLELTPDGLRKRQAGTTLDLCGIAKGRALDLAAQALSGLGLRNFALEMGGEVTTRGRHPSGRPWQIAIEGPLPEVIRLDGRAIATSGGLPHGYEVRGRGYSHIIDPRSGAPVRGGVESASVIADTAMEADALATALCSLDADSARDLAGSLGLDARLVFDGRAVPVLTGRFAEQLAG